MASSEWLNYDQARRALTAAGLSPDQAGALLADARNTPGQVVSLAHGVTVRCGAGTRWTVTWHDHEQENPS